MIPAVIPGGLRTLVLGAALSVGGRLPSPLSDPGRDLASPTVLEDVNVVDIRSGRVLPGRDVLMGGGRILAITEHGRGDLPEDVQRIPLAGRFVMPGLIEGHGHVSVSPEVSLTLALQKGVVAVRDMAGDGGYLSELQVAVEVGELLGPDIYFSALMGGPELIFGDSRVRLATPPGFELGKAPWARLAEEGSNLEEILDTAKEAGATGIKLYAYLSADLVRRLSQGAHDRGLKVWAHLVPYPATAEEVVSSGVDVVSHSAFFLLPQDWEFRNGSAAMDPANVNPERLNALFSLMVERGVALDPTILVTELMVGSIPETARQELLKKTVYQVTGLAARAGVKIIAGTDMPLPATEAEELPLHRELELLVSEAGLSPADALKAATLQAAETIGLEGQLGAVEPGMRASLVILRRDPLKDISAVEEIVMVFKDGLLVPRPLRLDPLNVKNETP